MTTETIDPTTPDPELEAVIRDVLDDHERPTTSALDATLWRTLEGMGLTRLTGSDEHGGSGAGWPEAAALVRACARHGALVPVVEHDLLAGWLVETAGLPATDGVRTVAVLDADGAAADVPWAGASDRVVLVWPDGERYRVADAAAAALEISPATGLSDEPAGHVRADLAALEGVEIDQSVVEELRLRTALARSLQISAAMDAVLASSVRHATERVQFGRPLARFQAVQNLVADIAAQAGLARVASTAALVEVMRGGFGSAATRFAVAAAASCVGHASSTVVRNAHQVHGAMGTTREHSLHTLTRPILRWRNDPVPVREWDRALAEVAVAHGAIGLWPLVTDGADVRVPGARPFAPPA